MPAGRKDMPSIGLGLIGAGRWGRNYIRTISQLPGVSLRWLASTNPKSRDLVDEYCRITGDWTLLARNADIDGVIVASPPALHAPMVHAAAAAGKPVLVEKPFTLNLEEARETLDFVERRGGYFLVNHIQLFNPAFLKLKQLLPGLGAIRSIESVGGGFGPFRADTPALWDWGPHDIAMCCDLMGGPPRTIESECAARRTVDGVDGELIDLRLIFPGDVAASIRIGNLMAEKTRYFKVTADGGSLIFDDRADDRLVRIPAGEHDAGVAVEIEAETPLSKVVRHFASAIRGGAADIRDSRFGVEVVEVLDRCEKALRR